MQPRDPNYQAKVQACFDQQPAMATLGATLDSIAPGKVEIGFPYNEKFTQQHGYVHAGIVTTLLDNACGCAAFTLMPAEANVLSVEFKVNLLRPAQGRHFVAKARVVKAGKVISVVDGALYSSDFGDKEIATMTATIMTILP